MERFVLRYIFSSLTIFWRIQDSSKSKVKVDGEKLSQLLAVNFIALFVLKRVDGNGLERQKRQRQPPHNFTSKQTTKVCAYLPHHVLDRYLTVLLTYLADKMLFIIKATLAYTATCPRRVERKVSLLGKHLLLTTKTEEEKEKEKKQKTKAPQSKERMEFLAGYDPT